MPQREKFTGCLLGLAIGDALGAPLEFLLDHDDVLGKYGSEVTEMIGGGWLNLKPGEYTDDTQMALCIARSLVELKSFDPKDIARRFVDWYDSNPPDIGNTTRIALEYLKANPNEWDGGKLTTDSGKFASNGSLMRCAPVALMFAERSPNALNRASRDSSRITHGEERAQASCTVLNLIICDLLNEGWPEDLKTQAFQGLDSTWLVGKYFQKTSKDLPNIRYGQLKPTGFCLDSLECALWCVYHSNSFEEALIKAVNLGGDADTIGAITGALAGALWGEFSIPTRWLEILQDKEEITQLGKKLYEINRKQIQDLKDKGLL